MNKLFFGDNLHIMRDHIPSESIDLIYLDPPFNSKANYNVLFKEQDGSASTAQVTAFVDTWHWGMESEEAYMDLITSGPTKLANLIQTFRSFLGTNDMMAYLTMIAIRLAEMYRVLKSTGSIYFHCDPTASHYIKLVMDAIFGHKQFKNEIVWHYRRWTAATDRFQRMHDIIFYYGKHNNHIFNPIYVETTDGQKKKHERGWDRNSVIIDGRRQPQLIVYNKEKVDSAVRDGRINPNEYARIIDVSIQETIAPDVWLINVLNSQSRERLGYPTQKPESLLERIIQASSNEGDVVMDPFCGCGTTVAVAERLNREWIGIDMTHLAISLMRHRLEDTFGPSLKSYEVIGDPKDIDGAKALALHDRYQFEWWALGKIAARPAQDKKKGADKGVDGVLYFFDNNRGEAKKIIVQVKSGNIKRNDISTLNSDRERENAVIGAFITLHEPTRPMIQEALSAGFYVPEFPHGTKYPRIQILTIADLLAGKQLEYSRVAPEITFKRAERIKTKDGSQSKLEF